ncbi:unnamed protein product [Leptidea sinapis]|uniref:Ig-like domain-containing protein n=1 Tax=Leptidea sinapis TaxID=189913 RepID=A0A5E4QAB9_9NEOP|nr:unnamed protein product [Leptidea sinapis]
MLFKLVCIERNRSETQSLIEKADYEILSKLDAVVLSTSVVGPLEEGNELVLVCEVRGGRPAPTVEWLVDGVPAPQFIGEKTDTHVVVNKLELPHLKRSHLNTTFKCRASNTNLVSPQEKSVSKKSCGIYIAVRPTSVQIVKKPPTLSSERGVSLSCVAEGSRPPAELTWFKDNRIFSHPPVVSLSLGSTLNPNEIKEGDDVYFECSVRANPKEHRISWYHNDKPVVHNVVLGVIVSTKSLVLQKLTRDHSGDYSCRAANSLGETTSQLTYLRAQLDETLRVRCSVTANPPDVTFFWQFNSSGESLDVSPSKYGKCVAGYDGGLPQSFVLQALDPITNNNKYNITINDTEGATFNLLIYAKNLKGESEKTLLENIAFNDAARRTALGLALAAGGIALVALCARRKRAQPPNKHPPGDMLELSDGGRRYVVAYTIKSSPDSKTPEPQPDILNAPGEWNKTGVMFCAEDLALLDSAGRPQNLTTGCDSASTTEEDVTTQNLSLSNNFRPNLSPTLGSPNFVYPNGNMGSPFGSQTLTLSGPTLSSGSLSTSTLRKGKSNVRRREHVLAENLPGPESCV